MRFQFTLIATAIGAFATQGNATIIADSVAEFSGVQGRDNWYYGYWDRTNDADGQYLPTDFQPMTQYLTGPSINYGSLYIPAWYVQDLSYWSCLHSTGGAPNGLDGNQGRLPIEHWTTRRWVSEVSGSINITGDVSIFFPYGGQATARIVIDGAQVWASFVSGSTSLPYSVNAIVSVGSSVDFMIDPFQSSDISDHVQFTAAITPEPSALALLIPCIIFARRRRACALAPIAALALIAGQPTESRATIIADSVAEFSGVQGQDNWYYGYWDRTNDADGQYAPNEFQVMTQHMNAPSGTYGPDHGSAWYSVDGTYWTSIWQGGQHPNGTNGNHGHAPVEQWSIRRWVSELSGQVSISGLLGCEPGWGCSVVGMIVVDGDIQFSQTIPTGQPAQAYAIPFNVNVGSFVDFVVSPNGPDVDDHAYFTALITPEPASLSVLGVICILGLSRRRRVFRMY